MKTSRGMVDERAALADLAALAAELHEDAFQYYEFPARTDDEIEHAYTVAVSYHRKIKKLKELVASLHYDETVLPKPNNR